LFYFHIAVAFHCRQHALLYQVTSMISLSAVNKVVGSRYSVFLGLAPPKVEAAEAAEC